MDTFYTYTYLNALGTYVNLKAGDIYQFRIKARNIVGDSASYATVSVMAATLASAPGAPTRKFSSETSIGIQWTAPADNGGTPITDYQVFWDSGVGGAYTLLGNSLNTLEYTPSYTLNTGYTYRFKVKAVNYIGVGPESASVSVIAASYPDEPTAPYLFQASQN